MDLNEIWKKKNGNNVHIYRNIELTISIIMLYATKKIVQKRMYISTEHNWSEKKNSK